MLSHACQCDWRRQDPKHIIAFCTKNVANRHKLHDAAGTDRRQEILGIEKGLRAVLRWVMGRRTTGEILVGERAVKSSRSKDDR